MSVMSAETVATATTEARAADVRDALTACLLSAGKAGELPVLCTVHIAKEHNVLTFTSTDRYRLTTATIHLGDDATASPDFAALVTTADAKRIADMLPKRPARGFKPPVFLSRADDRLIVSTYDGEQVVRTVDGEYPRVASIIAEPTGEHTGATRIGFRPAQMADLCKMPGRGKEPVALDIVEPNKPLRSTWGDVESVEYLHILMPVRLS